LDANHFGVGSITSTPYLAAWSNIPYSRQSTPGGLVDIPNSPVLPISSVGTLPVQAVDLSTIHWTSGSEEYLQDNDATITALLTADNAESPWEREDCLSSWDGTSEITPVLNDIDPLQPASSQQSWALSPGEYPQSTLASSLSTPPPNICEPAEHSHINEAIFLAAKNGHVGVLRALAESGADLNARDEYGNSVLHLAMSGKHRDVVSMLLQHKVHHKVSNADGLTPL
jgi:hypothetical protein